MPRLPETGTEAPRENRARMSGTWRTGIFGAPLLDCCIAHIECLLEHVHPGGDHEIIVGRVHRIRTYEGEPLIFHRSQFATVAAGSHARCGTSDRKPASANADPAPHRG